MGIVSRAWRTVALCLVSGVLLLPQAGTARERSHPQQHAKAQRAKQQHARQQHAKQRHARAHAVPATPHRTASRARPAPAQHASRPLIVIDPGHGGRDPGAVGASGTLEKTVTLNTAVELRRALEATGRYRIALTRSTDQTMSLGARLAFARVRDADLLIAIHADASANRHARGASVYISSGSVTTRLPANRSNSNRIATALSGPEPLPDATSAFLQFSMIEQLADDVRMVATPARHAHFYVLASRQMPSALLEMGFLSNRQDEALLRQPAHRRVIVRAISDAVADYFTAIRARAPRS